jgi:hypothetical protein
VNLVIESDDSRRTREVVPNAAGKEHYSSKPGPLELTGRRREREGATSQAKRHGLASSVRRMDGEFVPRSDPFSEASQVPTVPNEPARPQRLREFRIRGREFA